MLRSSTGPGCAQTIGAFGEVLAQEPVGVLGLKVSYPHQERVLVYLYWEPTNAGGIEGPSTCSPPHPLRIQRLIPPRPLLEHLEQRLEHMEPLHRAPRQHVQSMTRRIQLSRNRCRQIRIAIVVRRNLDTLGEARCVDIARASSPTQPLPSFATSACNDAPARQPQLPPPYCYFLPAA